MSHNFAKHFQFSSAALHTKYVTSASEWTCLAWTHNTGSKNTKFIGLFDNVFEFDENGGILHL